MNYDTFTKEDRPFFVFTDVTEVMVAGKGWALVEHAFPYDVGRTIQEAGGYNDNDEFREPVKETECVPSISTTGTNPDIDVIPHKKFATTGEARQFETGARRDANNDKGRMDLLPWLGLIRLSKHFQKGAATHGERNWEKGMPISVLLDSVLRHLAKAQAGLTDEDHITAGAWGITCILEELERIKIGTMPATLNDVANLK